MKFLLIFLFPVFSWGQQYWNTSCNTAKFLSETNGSDTNIVSSQPNCTGPFTIYYYYRADADVTSAVNIINYSTTASTTYRVYGPFTSKESACSSSLTSGLRIDSSVVAGTSKSINHKLSNGSVYLLVISIPSCSNNIGLLVNPDYKTYLSDSWETEGCTECVTEFRPAKGTYVVSAWVKDKTAAADGTIYSYSKPSITISSGAMTPVTLNPSGAIIDGWQRIEGEVSTTAGADGDFNIALNCSSGGECYFDDIRVFPVDGSMVTYVYDPATLRLLAELDERNYAKLYEYDEDGKLIRVKKETERGVMTIQESRENNSKE